MSAHRALPLADNWPSRRVFVPQGCDQQGRQAPSIPFGGCDCALDLDECQCLGRPVPETASAVSGIEFTDEYEPVKGREAAALWVWLLTPGTVAIGVAAAFFPARHGYL